MFGPFTFFYATLHILAVAGIDLGFDWAAIVKDLPKRPFITVGFAAYVLLLGVRLLQWARDRHPSAVGRGASECSRNNPHARVSTELQGASALPIGGGAMPVLNPVVEEGSPALAEKLRRATPHWTRHTHATHLLEGGAELTTVRDNLRHASLATTSMYLHTDDARRARQVADRFAVPRS
jgi:integrase